MWCDSKLGEGSEFGFKIPVKLNSQRSLSKRQLVGDSLSFGRSLRILVVDDSVLNVKILTRYNNFTVLR